MNMKKTLAIGIIALFIGLSFTPLGSAQAQIEEKDTEIPIQIGSLTADGRIATQTISLSKADLSELLDIMGSLRKPGFRPGDLLDRLKDLFDRDQGLFDKLDIGLFSKLPGNPIVSIGEGRELLSRYHGRVQLKKLVSMWNYPGDIGATVIWGNGLTSVPTQVLLQKQIGFMVGFVGLYMYIPPLLEDMNSKTFFMGTAMFAWGLSA